MSAYPHPDLVYKIHVYVMASANSDPESLTGYSIAFDVYTYKLGYLINALTPSSRDWTLVLQTQRTQRRYS